MRDAPSITPKMLEFLEEFECDSGGYGIGLQQLNDGLEDYNLDPEVQPLVDWLREYLKDGNTHDFETA